MTQIRLEVDTYTKKVLDVVNGKHGLKNRGAALRKFVDMYGEAYVEKSIDESFLHELDEKYALHKKKNVSRSLSDAELDELLGLYDV